MPHARFEQQSTWTNRLLFPRNRYKNGLYFLILIHQQNVFL